MCGHDTHRDEDVFWKPDREARAEGDRYGTEGEEPHQGKDDTCGGQGPELRGEYITNARPVVCNSL